MVSQIFKDCLSYIYRGEQVGEALFEVAFQTAKTPEQRYIMGSLLQLETEGKTLIRPMLMKLGVPIDVQPEARSEGEWAGNQLIEMSWEEQFAAMADGIEKTFLAKYEELAKLVTEEEDPAAYKLATFMGAHERAILTAAQNVVAGTPDPVAPVVDLLHFPLLKPASAVVDA